MRATLIIVTVAALSGCAETRTVQRHRPGGDCESVMGAPSGSNTGKTARRGLPVPAARSFWREARLTRPN